MIAHGLAYGPLVSKAGYFAPNSVYFFAVYAGNNVTVALGQLGDYLAPWVDDNGVPIRCPVCAVCTMLCRCNHIALIFDRSCSQ